MSSKKFIFTAFCCVLEETDAWVRISIKGDYTVTSFDFTHIIYQGSKKVLYYYWK